MGIDLKKFEQQISVKAKEQEQQQEKVESSNHSSNPISGRNNSANNYSEVSVFSSSNKDDKKDVKDEKYQDELDSKYKDDDNLSARDSFATLTNAGILNEKYYDRMICATEKLVNNTDWLIGFVDDNGNVNDVALADAVAQSFDSELDLYIQEAVKDVLGEVYCSKSFKDPKVRQALAEKGIRIDSVGQGTEEDGKNTNRVYSFSLVDVPSNFDQLSAEEKMELVYSEDAKILEDKAGNKGSYLFADALIPDGYAQNAETNMSSILDTMGYDCISKADFIGANGKFDEAEYQAMLSEVASLVNSGELSGSDKISETYSNTREITESITRLWGGDGSAPGQTGIGGGTTKEAAELEAEQEKVLNDKYEEILKDKKADYKEEHGEEATGEDLAKLEREAKTEAKNQL